MVEGAVRTAWSTATTPLLKYDSTWKYLDDGSDPGTNWNRSGFDDGAWPGGSGLFGAAPPGIWPYPFQTAIEPRGLGGPETVFYRAAFQWDGSTNDINLVTTNLVADGVVFYLNGVEVGRLRVPPGQNHLTLAAPQPNPGQAETITLPVGRLLPGENLFAAEVHQSSATANQDVFGLELTANVSIGYLPTLTIGRSGGNTVISWSGPGTLQSTPSPALPWSNLPASSPYITPLTNGIRFYRLRVP